MQYISEGQAKAQAQVEASGLELDEELADIDTRVLENLNDDLDEAVSLDAQTTQANASNLSLSDLDELLAEDDDTGPLDSLDALLGESLEAAAEAKRAKSLRQRIRTGQARPDELEAYKAWEAKAHWVPQANCEIWRQITCQCCGTSRRFFSQLMVEYRGAGNEANLRYVGVSELNPGLTGPVKLVMQESEAPVCDSCPGAGNIDFTAAIIWKD